MYSRAVKSDPGRARQLSARTGTLCGAEPLAGKDGKAARVLAVEQLSGDVRPGGVPCLDVDRLDTGPVWAAAFQRHSEICKFCP